jgi:hypothetical protein
MGNPRKFGPVAKNEAVPKKPGLRLRKSDPVGPPILRHVRQSSDTDQRLFLLALGIIALGIWVYIAERPSVATPFFAGFNISDRTTPILGRIALQFPSFAHAFSFSVFSAALVARSRYSLALVCGSWFALNAVFEFGQLANTAQLATRVFGQESYISSYFLNGVFDPLDLLAAAFGSLLAYWLLVRSRSVDS